MTLKAALFEPPRTDTLMASIRSSDLPSLLPLYTAECRMYAHHAADHFGVDRLTYAAWGVFARDVIMSRAIDAKLIPAGLQPRGENLSKFISWFSNTASTPWHTLLNPVEREERIHVHRVAVIVRRTKFNDVERHYA